MKNMDFGAFFGNIYIIKALNFQIKGAQARIASNSSKFSPVTQYHSASYYKG